MTVTAASSRMSKKRVSCGSVVVMGQPLRTCSWKKGITDFFFQAEDGIRDKLVTGVQTSALPISASVACIVTFYALHTIGGRYTCTNTPYDSWAAALFGASVSDIFGFERNHYDRLVHFSYGLRSEERRVGKEGRSRGLPCY